MRTLFMEVFFQTVILLSLIEEDASLLVTVPAGVGVLIQVIQGAPVARWVQYLLCGTYVVLMWKVKRTAAGLLS